MKYSTTTIYKGSPSERLNTERLDPNQLAVTGVLVRSKGKGTKREVEDMNHSIDSRLLFSMC